jgi:GAF domain-containing protein
VTKTTTKAGVTGKAVLGTMQAVERALARPSGPSPDQLIARIQEWQQGVKELVRQQELGAELATLYEMAGFMSSSLDLAETLDLVMDALIHLTGAERGCLMLLNDEGHPQVRAAQSFDQESLDAHELELSRTVVQEAVDSGQPVLTTNAQRDPRFSDQESVIGYHLRSIVCVPLCTREEVIGALYLDNRIRDGAFSEADLDTLTTFANQATLAIQNARLYTATDQALTRRMEELTHLIDQEQSHTAELATLNSLSQALTARLDVEQVLDEAYRGVSQLLDDATNFYIALYDPDKDEVTFSIDVTEGDVLKSSTTRRAGKGLTEHILRTQKPVLIREDVPTWLEEMGIEPIGRMAHSWLGVPLTIGDQTIGVMAVQSYTAATSYDEHDQDLLMAIASQTAIAIYNARLYEQAQFEITERRRAEQDLKQRNDELTTLYEAATAIGSALSLDDVLLAVAKQMTRAVESTGCALSLWNREQDSVETLVDYSLTRPDDSDLPGTTYDLRDYPATRRVLETGRPIVLQHDDPMADETELALMREQGIRTLLMLPLVARDQIFGLVELVDEVESRNYATEQIRLAQSLAVQAAISIENARLYEEAQSELVERRRAEQESERRAAQTTLIYEVGQRVSSKLELETLLSEIVGAVQDTFDYYSVLLMLLDETGERLVLQSVAGHYVDVFPDDLWVAVGEGMTGQAAATGETQFSGDVSQHPHYVCKTGEVTRSELAVAIKSGQRILGVLDLQSDELDAFDATDVMLMETLADQVAVAIENARLYEETQLRLREQATLFDISQRLASAPLRAKEIAEVGVREIAALMESTECSISLYDPQEDLLHTLADLWIQDGVEHREDAKPYSLSDYPATARIMETLQPLVVQASDPNADPAELDYLKESGSATLAVIPLTIKGQVIGLLELETGEEHHYTQEELNIAVTLANQVAAALDNAQLYSSLEQELAERQRAEERLQRYADELEQSNEEVRRFAYIVSHDLRAPLVNLKGFAAELRLALSEIEAVVSTVADHLDEEQKQILSCALEEDAPEALAFIDTSATHMDHFISALLKLSRLGRRELKLELVDVNGIVETCLQTLAHQIAESQTEVSVGQLPEIVADQTSIEQIVGNILSNAIKYLHPDRPGKVEITAAQGEDETLFQIRDNGRGIDPRNMDKVFAPFRRAGNEDVPGDGMGLAYVQALVRRHAGRIWCESEPGVGTLMSFTIPHHLGDDNYVGLSEST